MFERAIVVIRGGGDLATGVAYRLHQVGFPVIVLELAWPLVIRRKVSLASAVFDSAVTIESLEGQRTETVDEAIPLSLSGVIPVVVSPQLPTLQEAMRNLQRSEYRTASLDAVIDARMAKRNIDTAIDQAPTVIALGPGFSAGVDCHAVIETMRGHRLGRVIWQGEALPNTGTPGFIDGHGAERVLRAPAAGVAGWNCDIGDVVSEGMILGQVNNLPVTAPFDGVIRGLIMPGTRVKRGQKIGDVDSRANVEACFTISDKALSVGGGVLEAILARVSGSVWGTPK